MSPLHMLEVLDFSHVIAGPLATLYLAQLGAQVTKIEKPGGDIMGASSGDGPAAAAAAAGFAAFNAGKQHLSLDLKTPAGRDHALALASTCDVLVDNYRPGVLARHGLSYEVLAARNPRLIYCAISGYGTLGGTGKPPSAVAASAPNEPDLSWQARGAYDHVIQAATGMAMLAGKPGDPPIKMGAPVVDVMTGVLAAFAITAAVTERARTGRGCYLDASMWAAAMQLMYPFSVRAFTVGESPPRVGNQGYSGSPGAGYFPTQDGMLAVGANTAEQMAALYHALGLGSAACAADILPGAGFVRARDPAALHHKLAQALLAKSADQWEALLSAAGVPAAKVRQLHEAAAVSAAARLLHPTALTHGGATVQSPGLGWQTYERPWTP